LVNCALLRAGSKFPPYLSQHRAIPNNCSNFNGCAITNDSRLNLGTGFDVDAVADYYSAFSTSDAYHGLFADGAIFANLDAAAV
jgi:hypothetical protein